MREGPPLSGVKAVFFDLDDTLCAYWDAARKGLKRAFELEGPNGIPPERMCEFWAEAFREFYPAMRKEGWYERYLKSGEPTRTEQMRRTLAKAGIENPQMARKVGDVYAEERNKALRLFPDALPVLKELHGRAFLGLITNGPLDVQQDEIDALQIAPFFRAILIEGDLGVGKPNPKVFQRAEELSGSSGGDVAYIGNSYAHDVLPALKAGWRGVWVRRTSDVPPSAAGVRSEPEQLPAGSREPDATVASLSELLRLF